MNSIKTSLLILSDTHGQHFSDEDKPNHRVDVVIHCGDLTEGSQLDEFHTILDLLKEIDSPLKLAIAGNHDFTLDTPAYEKKIAEATPPLELELVKKHYGAYGEARKLIEEAGIILLDEGQHSFTLANGARLTLFASPYTPSYGAWGFQYRPEEGHDFAIEDGTDIVITHGPPKGILDKTTARERAGCSDLFAAIAKARPRIHCFGHIHEGWGGRVVAWRGSVSKQPSHLTEIDNELSYSIETLASLRPSQWDSHEEATRKDAKVHKYNEARCCKSSHCNSNRLEPRKHTLFVNASLHGGCGLTQKPWLIDLDLAVDQFR